MFVLCMAAGALVSGWGALWFWATDRAGENMAKWAFCLLVAALFVVSAVWRMVG